MGAGWPFAGRQEELILIAQAMADRDVGGLVLTGAAGVGKTRLALEAFSRADPDRYVTRRAAATQATRPIPFGALAPLLPADLPAASDRVNLLRLAAEVLVSAVGRRRLVLGVDDAHLLDDLSAALVHQLVRTAAAFVLVTVRTGRPAPEPITALWRNRLVERVDLQELLRPDVEQVLAEHLGGPVDGMTVQRILQASAGNALMVRELVTAGNQAGALRRVEGVWGWQGPWVLAPRLVELIEQRLGQLDPAERDVLELLAYAEPIGPDLLSRLVSAGAVEAVEAKGLCWAEPQGRRVVVHLAHPLYAEALRASTPVLRARRRQRQLADVVEQTGARRADDSLQVAIWRMASGTTVSPQMLLAAATRAWVLLDMDLAERMARAAFQAGARLQASNVLWPIMLLHDRIDEGLQVLTGLDDAATTDSARAKLAVARAYLYWGYDPDDAHLRVIEEALATIVDASARAELQAMQSVMYAHACQFQSATQLADDLLSRPHPSATVLAYVHLSKAMAQLFYGKTMKAAAGFDQVITVHAQAAEFPWIGPVAHIWHCQAQLLGGEFTAAADAAEAAYQHGLGKGSNMIIGLACICRGQICRARGQLRQAMRWFQEGLAGLREDRGFVSQLLGELAHTAALLGDHARAEAALTEADATRRRDFVVYHLWIDLARPWVTAASGDRTAAARQALQTSTTMHQANAPVYEAVALHDAARLGAAAKVADRLRELAQDSDNILVRCYAAHAAALASHDSVALESASTEFETIGALLIASEAAAEASHAYRRAGRADSARRMAARAAQLATHCEDAATPAIQGLQKPDLTPRQWEIVKLAAMGLTNEEIAERLAVSIRTVHNHLHQSYAKLGVHSRTQLATVLGVQAPPAPERRPPNQPTLEHRHARERFTDDR